MTEFIRRRIGIVLFLLLCGFGSATSVWQIADWGNKLHPVDAGSEANTLREVRHFLEDGLTKNYGLGTVVYPGMYPDDGFTAASQDKNYDPVPELDYVRDHALTPDGVYTHYPPGPEYLAYVAAKLFGPEPVWRLRLLPIAAGGAAMIFLGLSVRRRFGAAVGWLVMAACAVTPAANDVFIGLHYEGYALALLMCEIGIAIGSASSLVPFALLGFCQGWMSFDYVFLVCLSPLATEAVLPRMDPGYQSRWRLAWARVMLAGAGFTLAHMLHFAQVWAYWGSLALALNDFGTAARHRSGEGMTSGIVGHAVMAIQLMNNFYLGVHPFSTDILHVDDDRSGQWLTFRFLGLSLGPWWVLITAALAIRQFVSRTQSAASMADGWLRVSLVGILLSSSWFMAMVNHGAMHQFIVYRHLFFAFFLAALFGAVTLCRQWAGVPEYQPETRVAA